jgi:hypothetical protein
MRRALPLILFATLAACGPHIDRPHTAPDRDTPATITKTTPALPIGRPETLKPGLNRWDNGDGTEGAVFARAGAEP